MTRSTPASLAASNRQHFPEIFSPHRSRRLETGATEPGPQFARPFPTALPLSCSGLTPNMRLMRRRRFRVNDVEGPVILVTGPEAAHALRVLRLGIGAQVELFDGRGHEVHGQVRAVSGDTLEVEVIGPVQDRSAPRTRLTIAVAMPKGQRADWLVEKCAELGVESLWLLQTARGIVDPRPTKIARLARKATAAAKQARLAQVMSIEPPRPTEAVLDHIDTNVFIMFGDPGAESPSLAEVLRDVGRDQDVVQDLLIFIGPEGGLTDEERELLRRRGGRPVRLGNSILRIETAAIAAAAIWACWAAH